MLTNMEKNCFQKVINITVIPERNPKVLTKAEIREREPRLLINTSV
jgi:hypothetical protein